MLVLKNGRNYCGQWNLQGMELLNAVLEECYFEGFPAASQ